MKNIIKIILFIYLISCKQTMKLENGYYYASANTDIDDNIEKLNELNLRAFNKLIPIKTEQKKVINEIIINEQYHSKSNLGTCKVNGCIIKIEKNKIKNKIFLTCNNVQIIFFKDSKFIRSMLLNEQGILEMDKFLSKMKD